MLKKSTKRFLLSVLTFLMLVVSVIAVACSQNSKIEIRPVEQKVTFRIGDSINMYDLIEVEKGVEYTFTVTSPEGQTTEVEAQTYLALELGDYVVKITAKKGEQTVEKELTISVVEVQPFLLLYGTTSIPLGSKKSMSMLISAMGPFAYAPDSSYELYFSKFTFYGYGEEGVEFNLENGETNKYFDGANFKFIDGGKYVFRLVMENTGGRVETDAYVEVNEDYDKIEILEGKTASYDENTQMVTWDEVEGAAYYKVGAGKTDVIVEDGNSLCITDYLISDFEFFDLNVVAIDENEIRLGKMVVPHIIITPDGFEGMILKDGVTIDQETRTVTLKTYDTWGRSAKFLDNDSRVSGQVTENDYVAFGDKYGVGTYVDFTFKGNNMPIVRFFANTIDGKLSSHENGLSQGNKGLIAINGIKSLGSGNANGSILDTYSIFGPNSMEQGYYNSLKARGGGAYNFWRYDNFPYLTMQGLEENENTEFKYTFGTQEDENDHTLRVHVILCKKVGNEWQEIYNFEYDTNESVDKYKDGYIIAMGGEKGEGLTSFTISQPYHVDTVAYGSNITGYNTKVLGNNTVSFGVDALYNNKLQEKETSMDDMEQAYIAFNGDYGVGYYVDMEFTGLYMPMVRFFANRISGFVTNSVLTNTVGNTGILISGGFETSTEKTSNLLTYTILPNMLTGQYGTWTSLEAKFQQNMGAMSQNGRNEDAQYKYTIGTSYDDIDNTIIVNAWLYEKVDGEYVLRHTLSLDTDKTLSNYDGRNLIILAPFKHYGEDTVITYSMPYEKEEETSNVIYKNASFGEDGVISLNSKDVNDQELSGDQPYPLFDENDGGYIGYRGDYGVGYFMDFEFVGNNMPIVRFFANTIDGYITKDINAEAKGMIIANGARTSYAPKTDNKYVQHLRIHYDMVGRYTKDETLSAWYNRAYYDVNGGHTWRGKPFGDDHLDEFGMARLAEQADTKFKYTVGTFKEVDGTLVVYLELYKWNGTKYELVESRSHNTGLVADNYSGNIVVLATMKKGGTYNEFTTSGPYKKSRMNLSNLHSDVIVKGDGTTMWAWPDDVQDNYKSSGTAIYLDQTTTGYVGYENYTVGKYLDFEFTGNNMPSVRFFADEINGYFTKSVDTDAKGIVVINGARTTNYKVDNKYYQYMRVYFDMIDDSNWTSYPRNDVNGGFSWHSTWFSLADDTRPDQFSMKYLNANSDTRFKYTVGTYLCDDGTVGVHMLLYKEVDGAWEFIEERAVNTGKTMDFYTGTNVVVLQPKNGDWPTAKVTKPYVGEFDMVLNNAVRKADGSIQMATELVSSDWNPNNSSLGNYFGVGKSYVGFDGNYGAGTYVDIEFYGKNMPIVRLFADQINGLFPTGTEGDASGAYFKPGRWTGKYNQFGVLYKGTAYKEGNDWAPAGNAALCLQNLDANLYYKYTVGSYLDTDGTLVFEFHLYSKATVDGEYVEITYSEADGCDIVNTYDTGKTMEELGFTAGDIVIMPFLEGAAKKDRFNNFSVSAPYTK